MGIMGRYIDQLPDGAKDRLIRAQDWCLAELTGPDGARCLVGHAEDWHPLAVEAAAWRGWMDGETGGLENGGGLVAESEMETACSPYLFAFRRARPADMDVYRERIRRWGLASEARIGSRFDRLCTRRGVEGAMRLAKARAARAFRPEEPQPRLATPVPVRARQAEPQPAPMRA